MTVAPCCVFEDDQVETLWPLVGAKPMVELWGGTSTILQKYAKQFGQPALSLSVRPALAELARQSFTAIPVNRPNHAGPMWFFNSRAWLTSKQWRQIVLQDPKTSVILVSQDQVVAMWLQHEHVEKAWGLISTIPTSEALLSWARTAQIPTMVQDILMISNAWDWVANHNHILEEELNSTPILGVIQGAVGGFTTLLGEPNIYIAEGAVVEDFVLIDATKGPVVISNGARIEAFSRLEGPLFIGANSQVLGGKLSATTVGPCSKVAGEVSKSIISGFSNKAHGGYLGDSYLGSWVNLGAGTTTSNLKNTYGSVQIQDLKTGQKIETGCQFLGSIIADHVKTAIGTLLNTGTLVGFGCNLLGSGVHSGTIPDLQWGSAGNYTVYRPETFFEVAKAMMNRRSHSISATEITTLKTIFEKTWNLR